MARQIYLLPREYKRRTRPRTVEDRQREKITELTHLRAEVQIRFSAWGLRGKPPYPPGGFPDSGKRFDLSTTLRSIVPAVVSSWAQRNRLKVKLARSLRGCITDDRYITLAILSA